MLEAGNNCVSASCEYSDSPVSGSRTTTPDVAPSKAGSSRIASMSSTRSASRACSSTVSARASWAMEGTRGISGTVTSTAVATQARSRPRRWLSGVERWGVTGVMKLLPVVGVGEHEGNPKQSIPLLLVHDRPEEPSGPARPRTRTGPFPARAIGKGPHRFGHLFGTSLRGAPPPRSSDRRPGARHRGHATPVPAPHTRCVRTPTARWRTSGSAYGTGSPRADPPDWARHRSR